MLGSLVGGFTGDSPGAETPGWTQSSWSSIPHCLDVRQVVCCSRSALESPTWCSSGTGPHPVFDDGYSSCPVALFVACQSPQPSLVPGQAQHQRNSLGLRKGIHTLADWGCFDRYLWFGLCCCRQLLLPLVFLRHRRGGGQSEVQVAVTTSAKHRYGEWRSGRLIATIHTTLVLVSLLRIILRVIPMAKRGAWSRWDAFLPLPPEQSARSGAKNSYRMR